MTEIVFDFETRSRLALGETNTYKYARHSSTEVLCMAYSIDGSPAEIWRPGEPFPFAPFWSGITLIAFNSEFELVIWRYICTPRYGWPELSPARIDCLQARSAYAGLPRNLADVGTALGLGHLGKDTEGNKIMQRLCKPVRVKGNPVKQIGCEYFGGGFDTDPAKHERNELYCRRDVRAESMTHRIMPMLPTAERELWLAHQRINERGVPVDTYLCRNAARLVEREKRRLCREIEELTSWMVRTPNCIKRFVPWARKHGYPYWSLAEDCIDNALAHSALSLKCRRALTIRKLYRDSAVSKYEAILNHAEADGCCRAAHVFYKAGPGRWAGCGVNFLNLRRLVESDVESNTDWADRISDANENDLNEIYEELRATEKIDDSGVISGGVIPTLAAMVRLAICARPGHKLVVCDYKGIEYRMLHWLAGDEKELARIRAFDRGEGDDPYKLAAAEIFSKKITDVTKAERQIGKVLILGCGYMAGAQTFANFCANYGIDMLIDRAQELVQTYRRMYPLVKNFWYECGRCAVKAVDTGQRSTLRNIEFFMKGCTLNIKLPSGRLMKYYDAKVVGGAYGKEVAALDQRTGGVKVVGLPILIENIDQGSSRDLLADALVKSDLAELPVVLHVYDEIVMEVPEQNNELALILRQCMRDVPAWAAGLPVDCDPAEHRRYTK